MTQIIEVLSVWGDPVGWALIHSCWQLTGLAIFTWIALRLAGETDPERRYRIQCVSLALMVLSPILTVVTGNHGGSGGEPSLSRVVLVERADSNTVDEELISSAPVGPAISNDTRATQRASNDSDVEYILPVDARLSSIASDDQSEAKPFDAAVAALGQLTPWVAGVWSTGVVLLSFWHIAGWSWLRYCIRCRSCPVSTSIHAIMDRYSQRLQLSPMPRIVEAAFVQVPCVAGWWRPVVLLPVDVVSGLSLEHMTAVIVHELAHIRRRDVLINAVQTLAETLLFFHPAVWWVSRQIRVERENCADDVVVMVLKDRVGYARALAAVTEVCQTPSTGLVAINGGQLKQRVSRILSSRNGHQSARQSWGWLPFLTMILLWASMQTSAFEQQPAVDATTESDALDVESGAPRPQWRPDDQDPDLLLRLGSSKWRHQMSLRIAAWSPDGKYIATGEHDGDVRVWNVDTGEVEFLADTGVRRSAWGMKFSADSSRLAFVNETDNVWCFSVPDGKQLFRTNIRDNDKTTGSDAGGLDWSSDGRLIAAKSGDRLALLNATDGTIEYSTRSPSGIRHSAVAFTVDAKTLAAVEGNSVRLFRVESLRRDQQAESALIEEAHAQSVVGLSFAQLEGRDVVVTGGRGEVRMVEQAIPDGVRVGTSVAEIKAWDATSGNLVQDYSVSGFDNGVTALRVLPDRERFVIASPDWIRIWSVDVVDPLLSIDDGYNTTEDQFQYCMAVSPDGTKIAAPADGNRLAFWNVSDGRPVRLNRRAIHSSGVSHLHLTDDFKAVASASKDGNIAIWNGRSGEIAHSFKMIPARRVANGLPRLSTMALSGDGHTLVAAHGIRLRSGPDNTASYPGTLQAWDVDSGVSILRMQIEMVPGESVLSHDGELLAIASDNKEWMTGLLSRADVPFVPESRRERIAVIDVGAGEIIGQLPGHLGTISSLRFDQEDRRLLSIGGDGKARLWNLETMQEASVKEPGFESIETSVLAHDCRTFAAASMFGSELVIGDINKGSKRTIALGNVKGARLAISADGRFIATAGQMLNTTTEQLDETLNVWRTDNGQRVFQRATPDGAYTALSFSNDGTRLVAGTALGIVRVWDTSSLADK